MSVVDVKPEELIKKLASKLEAFDEMSPPEWTKWVKTGVHVQRPPTQSNWWYIRTASIMRKLYLNQNLGVTKFRKMYGGRKNRGSKPEHKYRASGNIVRKALQGLEKAGLVKQEKGKGRMLTEKGRALLKEVAGGGELK